MSRYTVTQHWSNYAPGISAGLPKVGQWVKNDFGQRGQFLGVTLSGALVIRWQTYKAFSKTDALANKPLRQFAKIYGSK